MKLLALANEIIEYAGDYFRFWHRAGKPGRLKRNAAKWRTEMPEEEDDPIL
jgi:hypothetical protein